MAFVQPRLRLTTAAPFSSAYSSAVSTRDVESSSLWAVRTASSSWRPYITQVAVGKLKELGVFGDDYDTPDGTGVRDYIHVVDLAKGHVKALKKIEENAGLKIYNLGTGVGYSVLDIVKNFEAATGVKIPYVIKPRRAGDIATCYSDASLAEKELGWKAENGIKEMCEDSWRWQKNNPNGYEE